MKAISQEAKSAIIEALKENSTSMINYGEIKNAVTLDKAMEIVESFQTSDSCACATWIPVTERLPDDTEYVIVFQPHSSTVMEAYFSGGKWHSACEYQIEGIAHWQPLPTPPVTK